MDGGIYEVIQCLPLKYPSLNNHRWTCLGLTDFAGYLPGHWHGLM
jgi:hypothetical protein